MRRFVIGILVLIGIFSLSGCGSVGQIENETETVVIGTTAYQIDNNQSANDIGDNVESSPVNYMDEIKQEIHNELFREVSEETLDIIDRIFKHLEIETINSTVDGNDASVSMNITTVNAGKAWVVGMERYAITCAENLFAENYNDDATLYSYYLDEFESCVRHANYITMPVVVEMDYHNHRWEWDLDDDVVNAITGQLLAAIEGDLNSSNIAIVAPEVENVTLSEQNDINITVEMKNAASAAELYLSIIPLSRSGLFEQLEYEGYSSEAIEYALTFVGY